MQARTKANNIQFLEVVHINKNLDLALYKNEDNETYGLVEFFNLLHVLYRPGSDMYGYAVQEGAQC